jgi:glycosyltransferase involved in cell wall biosynthesis
MNKFSIILPVHNGGEYVKECVKGILAQTLKNFDLVILENKSTDGTSEWLETLNDDRVKIYPSATLLSIEDNWKRITDIPKNEFITLVGHDDLLHADYLAEMNNLIEKYPDASLYQAHFRFINAEGDFIKQCRKMSEKYTQSQYLNAILNDEIDSTGTGYMMRSTDYDKLGGIPPYPNLLFADHALWIQLTGLSYMAVSGKEFFSYRLNQSTSKLSGASQYIDAFYFFLDFLAKLKNKNEAVSNIIAAGTPGFVKYYCTSLSHRLLKTPEKQREGKTIATFIAACVAKFRILAPDNTFAPLKNLNIRLAQIIDSNLLTRSLYLLFRKMYSKPFYS